MLIYSRSGQVSSARAAFPRSHYSKGITILSTGKYQQFAFIVIGSILDLLQEFHSLEKACTKIDSNCFRLARVKKQRENEWELKNAAFMVFRDFEIFI